MRYRKLLLLFLLFINVSTLWGQPFHYKVFDTQDGLLSTEISSLCQDSKGYLWIGTAVGLSKYDGYSFQNYTTSDGLPKGRVNTILENEEGDLWISTEKGIGYYDGKQFKEIGFPTSDQPEIIETIFFNHDNTLWVGTNHRLAFLEKIHLPLAITNPDTSYFNVFPEERFVKSFAADVSGKLYLSNYNYLVTYDNGIFDTLGTGDEGKFNFFYKILIEEDRILASTREGEIFQYNNNHRSFFIPPEEDRFNIIDIVPYQDNYWALDQNGILIIDKTGQIIAEVSLYETANIKLMTCMIKDREGNFWLGSYEGLIRITPRDFKLYPELQEVMPSGIFSIGEDDTGILMLTSNYGRVYTKALHEDTFEQLSLPDDFPMADIVDNFYDRNGDLWLPTYWDGVMRVRNERLDRYWYDDGLHPGADIQFGFEDDAGTIWLGHNFGLSRMLFKNTALDTIINFHKVSNSIFYCYVQDSYQQLWFGADDGLYFFSKEQIKKYPLPVGALPVAGITVDQQNQLWVATQGKGLLQFKVHEGNKLEYIGQYHSDNGLSSDFLLDVECDKKQNIWLGTYMGISVIRNHDSIYHVNNYNLEDGMIDKAYQRIKLHTDQSGIVWAATSMGLMSFDPSEIYINEVKPKVNLEALSVNGSPVDLDIFKNNNKLVLSHKDNNLEFEIKGISLKNPGKNRIKFKLEGGMDEWSPPSKQQTISFNTLSPGDYTLKFLAANNDNFWIGEPAKFHFQIKPPFWRTWWFGLTMLGLGIISTLIIVKRRETRLKKEEREKSRVNQMIAELETKALRAQMNPHFIFNSLNAIQECIITEQIDEAYKYLFKFSRLLRKVLESSARPLITVEEEVDILSLYLELEALRFDDKFRFEINLSEDDELEEMFIPSLMIQPFVENAIWHGLMHKRGDRKLEVNFSANEESLICYIIDNGIGREAAMKLKKRKKFKDQSMAMQLISDRLQILEHETKKIARIDIVDQISSVGEPMGTQVSIVVPNDLIPNEKTD